MAHGTNDPQKKLLHRLRWLRNTTPRDVMAARRAWYYSGIEDFLLKEGRWYDPQPLPRKMKRGREKHCFLNAYCHAIEHHLPYVEGFAAAEKYGEAHHAWCLDKEDKVLEVTWKERGLAYIGVVFPAELVVRGEFVCPVLDPFAPDVSIFQQKWSPRRTF